MRLLWLRFRICNIFATVYVWGRLAWGRPIVALFLLAKHDFASLKSFQRCTFNPTPNKTYRKEQFMAVVYWAHRFLRGTQLASIQLLLIINAVVNQCYTINALLEIFYHVYCIWGQYKLSAPERLTDRVLCVHFPQNVIEQYRIRT
jgi:hypothetical protein